MTEGSQVPADFIVQFGVVAGSSLDEEPDTGFKTAVLFSVEGAGMIDEVGETESAAEVFGALGVLSRPLPPSTVSSRTIKAEVACLRTADGLVPISTRDLRLRMGGDGPGEGTVALVGYAGGFHSISPVDNDDMTKGAIQVVYCPYDYTAGVAAKAHAIILDPTSGNSSISVVHSDGQCLLLQDDGTIRMQSPDGQSFVQVEDDTVTISASVITLKGSVFVGDSATAVPLLGGAASQPSARLFISTP